MPEIQCWRIVDERYVGSALSGIGAEQNGGRFNSIGVAVVYLAETLSLALLENLVATNSRKRLLRKVCIRCDFDAKLIQELELPTNWDSIPHNSDSQKYGDSWIESMSSLVLKVPSVVVPQESNYLINPKHSSAAKIKMSTPIRVPIDPRLSRILST